MRFMRLAAAVIALVLAATGAALAHAKMTSSVPQDGATVSAGLSHIEVAFSHPMRLTLLRLHRTADNKNVPLAGTLPSDFADSAKVAVGALEPGAYDVSWTAVAKDGHIMKGHFAFTVAPAQ